MSADYQESQDLRRRVEFFPDGKAVLIQDTPGMSLSIDGTTESVVLDTITDEEWLDLKEASKTYDVVLDKATKALKLRAKKKPKGGEGRVS